MGDMRHAQGEKPSFIMGSIVIDGRTGQVLRNRTDLGFTYTEFEVLLELVRHAGKVVSRQEFPPWYRPVGDADQRHPVDDVISRIKRRLGDDLRIERVWGQGYKLIAEPRAIEIASPSSPTSDRHSVLGLDRMNLHTGAALRASVRHYEKLLDIEPDADAYVNLAMDYINLGHTGFCLEFPSKTKEKATRLIEEAIAQYPTFSSAYALRGLTYLIYEYDWPRAAKDFEKALEFDPNDCYAHLFLAHMEVAQHKFDSGLMHARKAAALDPRSPMSVFTVPWMLVFSDQAAQAIHEAEAVLPEYDPFAVGHIIYGWALEAAGRVAEAIASYERSLELEVFPDAIAALGHIHAKQGNRNAALEHLKSLKDAESHGRIAYVSGYHTALIHVGLGDNRRALDSLEEARKQQCDWLIYLNVEPRWKPLANLKTFKRRLQQVGLNPS
jgi:tetratricopeptide (TPR) repeat protein